MFNFEKHLIDLLVTSVLDLATLDSRPAMYSFCSLLDKILQDLQSLQFIAGCI